MHTVCVCIGKSNRAWARARKTGKELCSLLNGRAAAQHSQSFSRQCLGCLEVSPGSIPNSPRCLRTNRASPGTIYFTRIDTAMESWKSLWLLDCWGPADAPGLSYLLCCHELLGSSMVCWHRAASNLQDFSLLMGIMHLQNMQASLGGSGTPR